MSMLDAEQRILKLPSQGMYYAFFIGDLTPRIISPVNQMWTALKIFPPSDINAAIPKPIRDEETKMLRANYDGRGIHIRQGFLTMSKAELKEWLKRFGSIVLYYGDKTPRIVPQALIEMLNSIQAEYFNVEHTATSTRILPISTGISNGLQAMSDEPLSLSQSL